MEKGEAVLNKDESVCEHRTGRDIANQETYLDRKIDQIRREIDKDGQESL